MSFHFIIVDYLLRVGLVTSLLILLYLAYSRIRGTVIDDWTHTKTNYDFLTNTNLLALLRIHTRIRTSKPEKKVELVNGEFTKILAHAYDKPIAYFAKIRNDPEEIKKYVNNKEVLEFLVRPKIWLRKHRSSKSKFLSLVTSQDPYSNLILDLQSLVEKFKTDLGASKIQFAEV